MELKRDTEIVAAYTIDRWGGVSDDALDVYVACGCTDQVWVAGFEFGPTAVIVADSWESAFYEWIDNLPCIDDEDLPEAYGFNGWDSAGERTESEYSPETAQARFDAWIESAHNGEKDYPDLIEGYRYKSNFRGENGVVDVGHYEWLHEYNPKEVRLAIRRCD